MTIHIGHHFFGAGNLGDDFMMAGFLEALAAEGPLPSLTCCIPHPLRPMAARFPQVLWLSCEEPVRRACIAACDVWLGLGGAPWQNAVSTWFSDHLEIDRRCCASLGKPMFFLGVGGQDRSAFAVPELRAVAQQAEAIWTRDEDCAALLAEEASGRVRFAADLSHAFFAKTPPPPARRGRLTAVFNFDFSGWPGFDAAMDALDALPASERVWLAQESRPLPGAEQWLFGRLPASRRFDWRLQLADTPAVPLAEVLSAWPSGAWLASSRYHATVAGAWAGSRAVVVASNDKLRGASKEFGYPSVRPDASSEAWARALETAAAPLPAVLSARAAAARQSVSEFVRMARISTSQPAS